MRASVIGVTETYAGRVELVEVARDPRPSGFLVRLWPAATDFAEPVTLYVAQTGPDGHRHAHRLFAALEEVTEVAVGAVPEVVEEGEEMEAWRLRHPSHA